MKEIQLTETHKNMSWFSNSPQRGHNTPKVSDHTPNILQTGKGINHGKLVLPGSHLLSPLTQPKLEEFCMRPL